MSYTLTDAVTALKNQVEWLTRAIVLEPLKGLVDSQNKLFRLPFVPAVSGTLVLYDENGMVISSGYTVADYTTGILTFATAPSDIRYASYTAQAYADTLLVEICREGFGEMQLRYPRPWFLYTGGGTIYISTSDASDSEPVIGGVALSQNDVQKRLLHLCCRFALLKRQYEKVVVEDHLFRESGRASSMMIDTSKRPENMRAALEQLDAAITAAVETAQADAGDVGGYGGFVPGAKSDEYGALYEWWPTSKQGRGLVA